MDEELTEQTNDSLKGKPSGRADVRLGSGRKKGKLEPQTIERAKVLKAFRDRVAKNADRLFEAQMTLAMCVSMLFRVDKDSKGNDLPGPDHAVSELSEDRSGAPCMHQHVLVADHAELGAVQ